jgi:predicted nucleotidyltransferase
MIAMTASGKRSRSDRDQRPSRRATAGMVRRIVERFDPDRIILFRSHARGDASCDSDVDLLIVMRYQGSCAQAETAIRMLPSEFPAAKDIFVRSPEEFAWRSLVPGRIERPAALEGDVKYCRNQPEDRNGTRAKKVTY